MAVKPAEATEGQMVDKMELGTIVSDDVGGQGPPNQT